MAHLKDKEKLKKKLQKSGTKHERHKLIKDLANLENEELDYAGQESEVKGAKAVIEIDKEEEAHGEQIHWRDINYLDSVKHQPRQYKERLFYIGQKLLEPELFAVPKGFTIAWWQNDLAMGLVIQIPWKEHPVTRAYKISYSAKHDKAALEVYIEHAFRLMDYLIREKAAQHGIHVPEQAGAHRPIAGKAGLS